MLTFDNIIWHTASVNRQEREKLLGQHGTLIWFTGLSGSGKSTIANVLARHLHDEGRLTYLLDGDNLRHGLNRDLGFSPADRRENIRRTGEVAKLLVDAGIVTLAAFVSPFRADREQVRTLLGTDFTEIYVECPLSVCEERDPKHLYKKARRGEIAEFTGITSPYEPPANPEIILHTGRESLTECVDRVWTYLQDRLQC